MALFFLAAFSEAVTPGANGKICFYHNGTVSFMNSDGTGLMSTGIYGSRPMGSPKSQRIAFSCFDGDWEICLVDSDGTNLVQITNNTAFDFAPVWSPDGTKILFDTDRDGNFEIYVMDSDGNNPINLTNNAAFDSSKDWSPDGTKIAYGSNRDGYFQIFVMNADGSNSVKISNSAFPDASPSWSPDGSQILFNRTQDVWVMDADGSNQQNLTNLAGINDIAPTWSPDGTKIVFYSNRTGANDIFTMDPDGSNITNLTNDVEDNLEATWQNEIAQDICPKPQGFWKNNPSEWPVVLLNLGLQQYSQSELLSILNLSTKKDASVILARQLIAAKLNIESGAEASPVNALISQADQILSTFQGKLPYNVKSNSSIGQSMTSIATVLDDYNKGYLTGGCQQ